GGVIVELAVLIPALILQKHEAGAGARLRRARRRDGLAVESELLAHPERCRDPVHLLDVPEARRHEHGAIREPVEKGGLARLSIARQSRGQRLIGGWNPFENQTAALLMRERWCLGGSRQRGEECDGAEERGKRSRGG